MSDKRKEREKQNASEHLESALDSFFKTISSFHSVISNLVLWFLVWLRDRHPVVQALVTAPIVLVASDFLSAFHNSIYNIFWAQTAVISRDLIVQNLPIPVGLAIYLLFGLWAVTSFASYARVTELRERVEQLEAEVGE